MYPPSPSRAAALNTTKVFESAATRDGEYPRIRQHVLLVFEHGPQPRHIAECTFVPGQSFAYVGRQ